MPPETLNKLTGSLTLLRTLFGAFLFGMVAFLTAMVIIIEPGSQQAAINELLQLIAPIFMVVSVSTSIFLRKALLAKVHNETNALKLIQSYTSTRIIQMGLVDAAIIFAIVCYVLTTNTFFVLLAGIGILYFVSLFPLQSKMLRQLKLEYPAEL
jgi:hypothetical protein